MALPFRFQIKIIARQLSIDGPPIHDPIKLVPHLHHPLNRKIGSPRIIIVSREAGEHDESRAEMAPTGASGRHIAITAMSNTAPASKSRLADLFYETETEYYGLPPFGLLDEIGEGIVTEVLGMFERCPKSIASQIDFLSQAQIESVYIVPMKLFTYVFNRDAMLGLKQLRALFQERLSFLSRIR